MVTPQSINRYQKPVRVLNTIRAQGFGDAIIAGGAIRDPYFGITPRDYDVYLQDHTVDHSNTHKITEKQICQLLSLTIDPDGDGDAIYHKHEYDTPDHDSSDSNQKNVITHVFDVIKDGLLYQLIFIRVSPISFVEENFDVGLCKAYCDGTRYRYTEKFMRDARNKTLTIDGKIRTSREMDYILKHHIPKLRGRYPSFTVKVADHNRHLVNTTKYPWLLRMV